MSAELLRSPQVKDFIEQTATVLNRAVDEGIKQAPPSDIMLDRLKNSNYVFSGFKVFHQMNEAFPSLTDENGERKPFEVFLNEVQSIHQKYNEWYLKAEYDFAVASAQMAAKWEKFEQMGERYDLQYRTAGDKHVRETHARLHNVTLPVSSRFWDEYFPPNGWGCRCTVVQVRKGKYPLSDERKALADGSQSTTGKHQEMFRFNPGKKRACFPAYNPYTISACENCTKSGFKLAAKIPANQLCQSCKIVQEMAKQQQEKEARKQARKNLEKWYKKNLPEAKVGKFIAKRFEIQKGEKQIIVNKNFYNEVIHHYRNDKYYMERLELAKFAHEWIKRAQYKRTETSDHHEENFEVYEYQHDGVTYELKCKQGKDGCFLYYMQRK